ncbi:MAG TPA: hypothetical protein PLO24_13810 [Bacteroidales bacterium]|nr:hypothetical protein [Bacteroidales bacterium]HQH25456.1 hypothetical protein [Bacteroidales bacterium]HQJ83129.1 hypothetical protein [Bacteroidales bacterium]
MPCAGAMKGQARRRSATTNPNSGYANFNEPAAGYGLGTTSLPNPEYYYGGTSTHGYRLNIYGLNINRSFFAGLGSGVLFSEGDLMIPFYLDLRYFWNSKTISPYIMGEGGFLFNPRDVDKKTLLMIIGGGGIQFNISDKFILNAGPGPGIQMGIDGRRSFLSGRLGLGFKLSSPHGGSGLNQIFSFRK